MAYRSDEEPDIAASEIENYSEKTYQDLRIGAYKVKNLNGTFKCPFCKGKRKQACGSRSLLQHTSGVANSSARGRSKKKALHLALLRYLRVDLGLKSDENFWPPRSRPKSCEVDMRVQNLGLNIKAVNSNRILEEAAMLQKASYDAETQKMQQIAQCHLTRISQEQDKINQELKTRKRKLDRYDCEMGKRNVCSHRVQQNLQEKQQNVQRINSLNMASMELQKANVNIMRLIEEQKKEKEEPLKNLLQLEVKHKLQLVIEELNSKLQVMKHLGGDGTAMFQSKMKEMAQELNLKIGVSNHLNNSNETSSQPKEELSAWQKLQDMQLKMEELREMMRNMEDMEEELNEKIKDVNCLE